MFALYRRIVVAYRLRKSRLCRLLALGTSVGKKQLSTVLYLVTHDLLRRSWRANHFVAKEKHIAARTMCFFFGCGDGIFENELFATRGGDCVWRSARFLWELCTPCCAIFRGSQVSQGVLCGGGMDPAPLLKLKKGFNA